jgi:hypothetical protein
MRLDQLIVVDGETLSSFLLDNEGNNAIVVVGGVVPCCLLAVVECCFLFGRAVR